MQPYIIITPDFKRNSAGVVALHRLCHELNERGQTAFVTGSPNPEWNEIISPMVHKEGIVVYPEVLVGNPTNAKNIVRWILNTPGLLGGETKYNPSELLFTWSRKYVNLPEDRVLVVYSIEHIFNNDNPVERDRDVFWYGKGRLKHKLCPITDGLEEITYDYPSERTELANLLRKSRVFYTYDENTQLIPEAVRCGCKVVLLPENREFEPTPYPSNEKISAQIDNFIRITQGWAI